MKKIFVLAISAILVANLSAQEMKKECPGGKKLSKEERVEMDINRLTHELMLSDQQTVAFAATYREYSKELDKLFEKNGKPEQFDPNKQPTDKELDKLAKQRFESFKALADLQSKFYDKFRKDLSARQVEKVMRFDEPFGPKPCCGKHEGPHKESFGPEGPKPDFGKHEHHQKAPRK